MIVQHIVASNIIVLERIGSNSNISALAESIKKEGLHNPIHVIKSRNGYVLLDGEKRLKAVMMLGEPLIAVRVIENNVRAEDFYTFHKNYKSEKEKVC